MSLASKLNEKATPVTNDFGDFLPSGNMQSMFMEDCTGFEVNKIISEMQNGKSSDIPISVIKKTSNIIIKLGKITPIFKKEDEKLLKHYWPVSTLPIFGKHFEKIIYSRLYNFFVSQGILYDKQFGFRKSHSTNHALNYSISHIKSELKKKTMS